MAFTNAFWNVLIWILAIGTIISFASAMLKRGKGFLGFVFSVIFIAAITIGVIKLVHIIPENPFYLLNGLILKFYQWMTGGKIILAISLTLVTLFTGRLITRPLTALAFIGWNMYALPLAITSIATAVIIPEAAGKMTYLCYIGALFYVNVKFREGHKYQGPFGVANSYFFGLYMCHICFTYGLVYAIIAHVIYDAVIFSIEHLFWFIRNIRFKNKEEVAS